MHHFVILTHCATTEKAWSKADVVGGGSHQRPLQRALTGDVAALPPLLRQTGLAAARGRHGRPKLPCAPGE